LESEEIQTAANGGIYLPEGDENGKHLSFLVDDLLTKAIWITSSIQVVQVTQ
jgi:hypothetical protein